MISEVLFLYIGKGRKGMKKAQKKQAEAFIKELEQMHNEIERAMENGESAVTLELLGQCQQGVIEMGELIESTEGEGFITISILENYCEAVYQLYEEIKQDQAEDVGCLYQKLCYILMQIKTSVHNDIENHFEAVFLPYKASMWDSLESVWKTAAEDPKCDAYVIPIPYYDKNSDGSFRQEHYDGSLFPEYVDITDYDAFDFEEHQPDMIYIHNPYDDCNSVTSVHPYFYSSNLKQFTKLLVYIPYYSTTGGMSEGQRECPVYYNADYIIIQEEKYRKFFDSALPQEKLLALGSPKFDRVIHACNNPPEPPEEWKRKMEGKKVYFYNTSLNGMLTNTAAFLRKMEYVFRCFANRADVCLLWRPHPLLESTFDSMRADYKPVFETLKRYFIVSGFGIYDDTPDITNTIALCDAYIGDAGTSVTSLFGIAGKPLFILNNYINSAPEEDDWRGMVIKTPFIYGNHEWMVTQGNKLYHSPDNNYQYKYCCDLSGYANGNYYLSVIGINGKNYVCPVNAQNILEVSEKGIKRRINLERLLEQTGAFCGAIRCGKYLCLIPNNYPAIVRYDTEKDEVAYFSEYKDIFARMERGEKRVGGYCVQNGYLYIASPFENQVVVFHVETGMLQVRCLNVNSVCGWVGIVSDGEELWLLPYSGSTIIRWNPKSGEAQEYKGWIENLKCKHPVLGYECVDKPFGYPTFYREYVFFPPSWGNKYIRLNKITGEVTEWIPPFIQPETSKNGYYLSGSNSYFFIAKGETENGIRYLFSNFDRKLYEVNLETNEYKEIEIGFSRDEMEQKESGFLENSEWLQYACEENAFNSLTDFLDGNVRGNAFDRERQIKAYGTIAANHDGTSGEKIYKYMSEQLSDR